MVRNPEKLELPEDWKVDLLDNLAKRGSGHTPNKDREDYWNGGVKWVSLADSSALDGGYIFETDKEISNEGVANSSAVVHPKETVVLSRDAGIGKSGVLAEEMAVSQHFIAWRCDNSEKLNSWFLYNWLQMMKPEFERQAVGSTIKTIGLSYFKRLKIAAPPYPQQEKIAEILSKWDKAITTTERLLANAEKQKKALMQQLLTGKKRLPGFSGEWHTKAIKEISDRIQRKSDGNDYPILMISSSAGFVSQDKKFSRYMAGESVKNYILLERGDFAYNKGNSKLYQFGCIFDLEDYDAALVPHVYVCFRLKNGYSRRFYKYLFEADYLKRQLGRLVNTGVRNNGLLNIKPAEFLGTRVPAPSLQEQEALADVLELASQEVSVLKSNLKKLRAEKKALMQQLLTGKRRVKVN